MLPIHKVRWSCKICNQTYKTEHSLQTHLFKQHNTEARKYKCDVCSKAFISSDLLISHRKIHFFRCHTKKTISCVFCEKTFPGRNRLRCHLTRHTKEKPFFCQDCGQEFTSKFYRNQHQVRHHGNSEQVIDTKPVVKLEQVKQMQRKEDYHQRSAQPSQSSDMKPTIFKAEVKVEKVDEIVKQEEEMIGGRKMTSDVGTMNGTSPKNVKEATSDVGAMSGSRVLSNGEMETTSDLGAMNIVSPIVKKSTNDITGPLKLSPNVIKEKTIDVDVSSIKMSSNVVKKKSRDDRLVGAPRMFPQKPLRIPSNQRNYKCVICRQFTAVEKVSLQIHVRMVHLGFTPQKCDYCWKSFPTKTTLFAHVTTQHSNVAEKENN